MRILVVSPSQPHPHANHGGGVYLGTLLESMLRHAEVATVHFSHQDDSAAMPGLTTYAVPRHRNRELGILGLAAQRLRMLRDWGARRLPLEVAKHRSAALASRIHQAMAEFRPDVALVEFAVMAQYLPLLHGTKTVFTDHERGESVPAQIGPGGLGRDRDRRLWPAYVRRFYPMADLCQALNEDDAEHLAQLTGVPVQVRPALVAVPERAVNPGASGPVLLFFGNYSHHPNPQAACHLAQAVLPLVRRQMPSAELWLAGPQATPAVQALDELDGVRLLGFVEDLTTVMGQARCLVAPVFSGSGTRIKVAMAMAHGLPVVTNRLGLRGLAAPADAIATGDSPASLAAACVAWLEDASAAAAAGARARQFIEQTMSGDILVRRQLDRFDELCSPSP